MTLPEWHSALNDFPLGLLVASVAFDLAALVRRNASLSWAGYWSLLGGAATAVVTVVSGLLAEGRIESTEAIHRIVETHEVLGISLAVLFVALAGWRMWRRNAFTQPEQQSYIMTAVVAALVLLWTGHLGGTMVYRHAAGIPSNILQEQLEARTAAERQAAP